MIKSISFIAAMFILFVNCSGAPKTPDDLAKTVFESLKNNTTEDYLKCFFLADDIKRLYGQMESSAKSKEEKESVKKFLDSNDIDKRSVHVAKWYADEAKKEFNKIRQRAKTLKIDWEKTKFLKAEYKIGKAIHYGIKKEMTGITTIIFSHEDKKYRIELLDCIKIRRGWIIENILKWGGLEY